MTLDEFVTSYVLMFGAAQLSQLETLEERKFIELAMGFDSNHAQEAITNAYCYLSWRTRVPLGGTPMPHVTHGAREFMKWYNEKEHRNV